jgi:hypothetical protein
MEDLSQKKAILLFLTISAVAIILIDFMLFLRPNDAPFHLEIAFKACILTSEEYTHLETSQIENPQKEDFRNIQLSVNAINKYKVKQLDISVPPIAAINRAINTSGIAKLWTSKHFWQNHNGEDFTNYNYTATIFCRGASNEELRSIFQDLVIQVSYKNDHDDIVAVDYPLSKELKVSEETS